MVSGMGFVLIALMLINGEPTVIQVEGLQKEEDCKEAAQFLVKKFKGKLLDAVCADDESLRM